MKNCFKVDLEKNSSKFNFPRSLGAHLTEKGALKFHFSRLKGIIIIISQPATALGIDIISSQAHNFSLLINTKFQSLNSRQTSSIFFSSPKQLTSSA